MVRCVFCGDIFGSANSDRDGTWRDGFEVRSLQTLQSDHSLAAKNHEQFYGTHQQPVVRVVRTLEDGNDRA